MPGDEPERATQAILMRDPWGLQTEDAGPAVGPSHSHESSEGLPDGGRVARSSPARGKVGRGG